MNLHTPAVEHSTCPLVGGNCGNDARLKQSFLASTDATQPQAETPCSHNNAEAIIILDGHPKGPDTPASRPR